MKVHIYGQPSCSVCEQAKELCRREGIDFDYKVVGHDIQVSELEEMTHGPVRTVPQIFVTHAGMTSHVGGYNELSQYLTHQEG